ncbi:DUF397 domain-containing protein [Streptomyces antibioticus]|uniref:DUF397 domain-containing protein n=1 Tax=Streptomyces antibioticus TaxID=1890 RepID=UPI00224D11ED|nr:DUF397 domain-containing protein [Streptomyces antibioticus]MCX4741783.1 DUF397 domain-containing protein [Streptomyces antibioticus]
MSTSELDWFKSSYSSAQGDSCVEVAVAEHAVHIRDSKDVTRPHLAVGRDGWARFVGFTVRGVRAE